MEELAKNLVEKLGLDPALAEKVGLSLKENPTEVTQGLAGGTDGLTAVLEKFGIGKDIAAKVAQFLVQHSSDLPKWLGSSPGLLGKAASAIGGLFGSKQ